MIYGYCKYCGAALKRPHTVRCAACAIEQNRESARRRSRKEKKEVTGMIRVCDICGKEFETKHSGKKRCSAACTKIARARYNKVYQHNLYHSTQGNYVPKQKRKRSKISELSRLAAEATAVNRSYGIYVAINKL